MPSSHMINRDHKSDSPHRLANHHRRPPEPHKRHPVHLHAHLLELPHKAPGHARALRPDPRKRAVLDAQRHEEDEEQRARDGQALKVLGLAVGGLGHERDGRVEPGQAGNTGADEGREDEGVGGSAEAEDVGRERGSDAERDLRGWRAAGVRRGGQTRQGWPGWRVSLLTESASESSSCPSMELSFLQRATLPSRASKMKPATGNASACLPGGEKPVSRSMIRADQGVAAYQMYLRS